MAIINIVSTLCNLFLIWMEVNMQSWKVESQKKSAMGDSGFHFWNVNVGIMIISLKIKNKATERGKAKYIINTFQICVALVITALLIFLTQCYLFIMRDHTEGPVCQWIFTSHLHVITCGFSSLLKDILV